MARPWKHPKTGIFWLRKAVPDDLRALVGKREEKRTLGTRDPSEAKRRHAQALLEIEARWARLRAGLAVDDPPVDDPPIRTTLTELEAHERTAWMYRFWLDKHKDNPSQQTFWRTDLYEQLWRPMPLTWGEDGEDGFRRFRDEMAVRRLEAWCLEQADDVPHLRNLEVDEASRLKLAKAIAAATQRAA